MPWAMPPCCWPATSSGFSTRPQSSTATWRTGRTRPVSESTSTTATWAPKGNVAPGWTKSCSPTSGVPCFSPAVPSSAHDRPRAGTPATPRRPPSDTTAALGMLGPQRVIADEAEGLRQGGVVVAAVVGGPHDRLEGEAVGREEVAAANLGRVEPELVGGHVEHPLEEGGGLRPAGTPEGA